MNLEEIITAAVEKRINDIVQVMLTERPEWDDVKQPTSVEGIVARAMQDIAHQEVTKYAEQIREAIGIALSASPTSFEISAYSKINLPPKK